MNPASSRLPGILSLLVVASSCALLPARLPGQSAPAPAPAAAPADPTAPAAPSAAEETIIMSPFTVSAGDETGYRASTTLSGTRISSRLEDLGVALTVVTKQQLEDTAAVDLNDIFLYEANTEGMHQFAAFTIDQNGRMNDDAQANPAGANRIRGLGAANMSVGGFATNARIPVDTYNLDSVEIARGPNSNLFGLGGAAGTVNLNQAQGVLGRASAETQFRVDDRGGVRASADINRPLIKDVFAVRVAALYDAKGFIRKPSHDLQRRQYLAFTWHPFPTTTIRGSAEYFFQHRRTPNTQTPRDMVTEWLNSGRPTWDPVTWTATVNGVRTAPIAANNEANTLPRGLGIDTTQYSRPGMWIDEDNLGLWMVDRVSPNMTNPAANMTNQRIMGTYTDILRQRANRYPLFVSPAISDRSLYDWGKINFVSTNWNRDFADLYNLSIEQTVFRTPFHSLYVQAAGRAEDYETLNRNLIGNTAYMHIDILERLIDGSPNPYFMRPYVAVWEPNINRDRNQSNAGRVQANYNIDFTRNDNWTRWFGHHSLVGFYEDSKTSFRRRVSREQMLDDHVWVTPTNRAAATGRASIRYYMGDNEGFNIDAGPPMSGSINNHTYTFRYSNGAGAAARWISEPALWGEAPSDASKNQTALRTMGANLQSYFFRDRIITTFGVRRDRQRFRTGQNDVIDPATGWSDWDSIDLAWTPWDDRSGETYTGGIVVKPLSWLSVYYNQSDSFTPEVPRLNLLASLLPNPNGKGRDYGFRVNLLKNKLYASVNWYKTDQKDARVSGGASTVVGRTQQIDWGSSSFNLEDWATLTILPARYAQRGENWAALPPDEQLRIKYELMGLPQGWIEQFDIGLSDVVDYESKGMEFEINYNPSNSMRFKFTAAQTKTIDKTLSPATQDYIDSRLPAWTDPTLIVPGTDGVLGTADDATWWAASGAQTWYNNSVVPLLKLARATLGLPRNQVKEWTWSAIGNYNIHEGRFKGLGFGGSVRWQDKAAIGYYGIADADLVMRTYDPTRPIFSPTETMFDVNLSYEFRLLSDKIHTRVQLNGRDVFSKVELRPAAANPDGSPHSFLIHDGPQWILTTTFDF